VHCRYRNKINVDAVCSGNLVRILAAKCAVSLRARVLFGKQVTAPSRATRYLLSALTREFPPVRKKEDLQYSKETSNSIALNATLPNWRE
jgi:hypothetical protein